MFAGGAVARAIRGRAARRLRVLGRGGVRQLFQIATAAIFCRQNETLREFLSEKSDVFGELLSDLLDAFDSHKLFELVLLAVLDKNADLHIGEEKCEFSKIFMQ